MTESEKDSTKPTRKYVDFSFWVANVAIAVALGLLSMESGGALLLFLLVVGLLAWLSYFFAIGQFAKRMGRSPAFWVILIFITSPLGVWVSYIASFLISPRDR